MRISDCSSDVCSSDLKRGGAGPRAVAPPRTICPKGGLCPSRSLNVVMSRPITSSLYRLSGDCGPPVCRINLRQRSPDDEGQKKPVQPAMRPYIRGSDQSAASAMRIRPEESRVGKECVRPLRSRGSPYPEKKKK